MIAKQAEPTPLCTRCANLYKDAYILRHISGGGTTKVACAHCGKRCYGAIYEIVKPK